MPATMTAAVEIINGETGEVLASPERAPVSKRVSSLKGLFARAAAVAAGPIEASGSVAFVEGGRRLHARWAGDCLRPRVLRLAEYPDAKGTPGRSAHLRVRCQQCDPCRDAKRRRRQWAGFMETMIGAFRAEAEGVPPDVLPHLVPGHRTWMVTLTFNGEARLRLQSLAVSMRADAVKRCAQAAGKAAELADSGDALGRRLSGLTRRGPAPSDLERDPRRIEREDEARQRRFGLRHDTPAQDERFWWFRAAHRMASDYMRRLRASRPRSEGQVPLRQTIAVEPHKRDGFPHMHLLVHEQGAQVMKDTLVRCWSRRRDGAPSGGVDPAADLVALGDVKAKLVGGYRVVMGQKVPQPLKRAAFYAAKYSAKEGTLWRASKGYGRVDDARLALFERAGSPEAEEMRVAIRRSRASALVEDATEAAAAAELEGVECAPLPPARTPEGRPGLPVGPPWPPDCGA